MKVLIKHINFVFSLFLVLAAGFLAFVAIPAFGNKALIVRSGSMQPTINVGDLIVVQLQNNLASPVNGNFPKYKVGEIVAFKSEKNPKVFTSHRIASSQFKEGKVFYKTKGDANDAPDKNFVSEENIVGKKLMIIPYIGKLLAFAKSKTGFATVVITPALLVIFFEIVSIFREIRRQNRIVDLPPAKASSFTPLMIIFPILVSVMVMHNTFAFFNDTETSTTNTFTALFPSPTPSPSPIADHIVINEVMFDPDNPFCTGGEPASEWVEIFNPTAGPISLNGWGIHDNNQSDAIPNVALNAGAFAIITNCSQAEFTTIWTLPGGTLYIDLGSSIGNGLANGGDEVRLTDNNQQTVDHVSYGTNTDAFDPSVSAPVANHTIERDPDGVDTDTAVDFVDRTTPSPGS